MSERVRTGKKTSDPIEPLATASTAHPPADVSAEEVLDWDVWLPTPPPRPSGTMTVRLEFVGRDRPIPVDFPDTSEDEEA